MAGKLADGGRYGSPTPNMPDLTARVEPSSAPAQAQGLAAGAVSCKLLYRRCDTP